MKIRAIKRKCSICGKKISVKLYGKKYSGAHYFGKIEVPVKGTGEYKKISTLKMGRKSYPVVKWTGKKKYFEYWECEGCFDEAVHMCWLEETIEKFFGKKCKDYEKGCPCCDAWNLYGNIKECLRE